MPAPDPFSVLFGDLDKLGPSSRDITIDTIRSLPTQTYNTIVDAGCGTGEQTLILASELHERINAVDNNPDFLRKLQERAGDIGIAELVHTHCIDLAELGDHFPQIDLLWSEGAAYSIGFETAMKRWSSLLSPSGIAVVSELSWAHENIPDAVRDYFNEGYPEMKTINENLSVVLEHGFEILGHCQLPAISWTEGYYDVLEPKAKAFLNHDDESVRELAAGMIEEIDIFRQSNGCYSYLLLTLRPND